MSVANIEVVRNAYAAFTKGDRHALGEHFAEEIEWETPHSLPRGGGVSGRDAVMENFAQLPQGVTGANPRRAGRARSECRVGRRVIGLGGLLLALMVVVCAPALAAVNETPLSGPHVFGWGFDAPEGVASDGTHVLGRQQRRRRR